MLEEVKSSYVPDMIGRSCVDLSDGRTHDTAATRSTKTPTPAIANGTQTNRDGDGPGPQSGHDSAKSMKRNPMQTVLMIQININPANRIRPTAELELDTWSQISSLTGPRPMSSLESLSACRLSWLLCSIREKTLNIRKTIRIRRKTHWVRKERVLRDRSKRKKIDQRRSPKV